MSDDIRRLLGASAADRAAAGNLLSLADDELRKLAGAYDGAGKVRPIWKRDPNTEV